MYFAAALIFGPVYLILVHLLRYRRRESLRRRPVSDFWRVDYDLGTLEFPFMVRSSLTAALLKTYAIPSISAILVRSGHFKASNLKRLEDTAILLAEITAVDEERAKRACRRLNYIHGQYPISNDDFIYVLSVFALEPWRWITMWEWRPLEPFEKEVIMLKWSQIGTWMGIKNIPKTFDELDAWNRKYEEEHMVYAETNVQLFKLTVQFLLEQYLYAPFRPIVSSVVFALFDERFCKAMGIKRPAPWVYTLLDFLLRVRAWIVRNAMLPRPAFLRYVQLSPTPMSNGRYKWKGYFVNIYPDGYFIEDVGAALKGKIGVLGHVGNKTLPKEDKLQSTLSPKNQ